MDLLAGTGVATTLRIVHRPKPFLSKPDAKLVRMVTPLEKVCLNLGIFRMTQSSWELRQSELV